MPGAIILLFIALVVVMGVLGHRAAQQRREALAAWGASRGLRFSPDHAGDFDDRFPAFSCLRQGSGRYAYNRLEGDWNGRPFLGFDYHYETHSTDSKGRRTTHHHHFSAVMLASAAPLKPILIRPEGVLDRVSAFFGFEDINFESAEFSRRFHVTSPDRKWAYDLLHPRAMEFLMAAPVCSLEFDAGRVLAWRGSTFTPADFEQAAGVIAGLLDQMPGYLLKENAS